MQTVNPGSKASPHQQIMAQRAMPQIGMVDPSGMMAMPGYGYQMAATAAAAAAAMVDPHARSAGAPEKNAKKEPRREGSPAAQKDAGEDKKDAADDVKGDTSAQHGEAVAEEPSDAKVGDAGKDDKAKEKETETQEVAGHPTEADGAPTPKDVPQEREAAAEPSELPDQEGTVEEASSDVEAIYSATQIMDVGSPSPPGAAPEAAGSAAGVTQAAEDAD